jgi:hypothetical protein
MSMANIKGEEMFKYLGDMPTKLNILSDKAIHNRRDIGIDSLMHDQMARILAREKTFLQNDYPYGEPQLQMLSSGMPSVVSLCAHLNIMHGLALTKDKYRFSLQYVEDYNNKSNSHQPDRVLISREDFASQRRAILGDSGQFQWQFCLNETDKGNLALLYRILYYRVLPNKSGWNSNVSLISEGTAEYEMTWGRLKANCSEDYYSLDPTNIGLLIQDCLGKDDKGIIDRTISLTRWDYAGYLIPMRIKSIDYARTISAGTPARIAKTEKILNQVLSPVFGSKVFIKGLFDANLERALSFPEVPYANAPGIIPFTNWDEEAICHEAVKLGMPRKDTGWREFLPQMHHYADLYRSGSNEPIGKITYHLPHISWQNRDINLNNVPTLNLDTIDVYVSASLARVLGIDEQLKEAMKRI